MLAPGQGSQKPGFLTPWLDLPGAAARLRWQSALAGLDLVRLGTEADADEVRDTAKTQPLLVAAGLLAASQLPMHDVPAVAGHSVGELAAAAMAGVINPETAIAFAAARGREMAAACAVEATGMSAVLGGEAEDVAARISEHGLHVANHNGAGQIVAAGPLNNLEKLTANPPASSRVTPLKVAGAFHTPHMKPAQEALEAIAGGIAPAEPTRILLSNADGAAVGSGPDMLTRLVRQVTAPVRWDLCMASMVELGVTGVIELPPAGTLAGLAKRGLRTSAGAPEIVAVKTPDDLDAARDLIARLGAPARPAPAARFQVTVANAAGAFQPGLIAEGASVKAGQVIGQVVNRRGGEEVLASSDGVLVEWLAQPENPVAAGTPLARFSHPETGVRR